MALFEANADRRLAPDDTVRLRCTVKHAHTLDGHTEYTISVQAGVSVNGENVWSVSRRYRDFAALHAALRPADIPLPLPPKRLIGNMQPAFVAERQIALQNYLTEVLKHPILALSLPVRQFLDPKNYSLSLHELALQSVSVALRGDGAFELRGALPDIGWRIRKRYFLVSSEQSIKPNCLLSWQQYGPDRHLSDKDLQTALKCLQNMSHPYFARVLGAHALEAGACVVRSAAARGSLRDELRGAGAEWARPQFAKRARRPPRPLARALLARYGAQMLEALAFLHERGLPYGHLHPGNIVISNDKVLLLDIENGLLGAPSIYRPYLVELKGVNTLEAVDVYCFGHTLYEMACGEPLEQATCDNFPSEIPEEIVCVLRLCLSSAACRRGGGVPSARSLLRHATFANEHERERERERERAHLKFPLQLKQPLRDAAAAVERRLQHDQKMMRSERREARVREILRSEEEMRRQRRRRREGGGGGGGGWRSASSLADAGRARSHSVSTASSPTPPHLPETSQNTASTTPSTPPRRLTLPALAAPRPATPPPATPPPAAGALPALLTSIRAFNRANLQRVVAP